MNIFVIERSSHGWRGALDRQVLTGGAGKTYCRKVIVGTKGQTEPAVDAGRIEVKILVAQGERILATKAKRLSENSDSLDFAMDLEEITILLVKNIFMDKLK